MTKLKLFSAGAILTAMAVAPGLAEARSHHRYHHHRYVHLYSLPYEISYKHNYGPGACPAPSPIMMVRRPYTARRARQPISARTAAGTPATDPVLSPSQTARLALIAAKYPTSGFVEQQLASGAFGPPSPKLGRSDDLKL